MFTAHDNMEPTTNIKLTTSSNNNNHNNNIIMTTNGHNQINGHGHGHGVANGGNDNSNSILNGANNKNSTHNNNNNNINNINNNNNSNNHNNNNNNHHHNNNGGDITSSTAANEITAVATTTPSTAATPINIAYKNGGMNGSMNGSSRRDSASQVLTPLLQRDDNNINNEHVASTPTTTTSNNNNNNIKNINNNNNNNNNTTTSPLSKGHGNVNDEATVNSTSLYDESSSNNNVWKDSEEINNLKNELLHHVKSHENNHNHNNHMNHHNNHHHNNQNQNNNGLLLNGKNGMSLNGEKYNEQDPLTGLYNSQKRIESDESDFDSDLHGEQNENDRKEPGCGIFGCRPKWARKLASTHVFMVVFLLAYVLQGMYLTYFVSVITTIEKLFQIKSKTTGLLLSASEMGQISTAMLLTYFAGRGHRPRWIACGMVLFSIAAFSCSLPHFIFGEQIMHSSLLSNGGAITSSRESQSPLQSTFNQTLASSAWQQDPNLCLAGSNNTLTTAECDEDRKMEQASQSKITWMVLCIFFVSLLSSGVGQTAVATLGIPYIDDNVASKQSPMYMAITIGVRILGPASGFIVGSFCTRLYVNLSNPGFSPEDSRWIGAWWLGPVVIGSLMMCVSIAMFSFPKQLHGKRSGNPGSHEIKTEPEDTPKLRDFPKTVRRQLSNDILMFRTASCVFHLLPIAGLYTFLPKYLESQFRLAPYDANMIAAFGGVLVMGVGIVIAGMVILKLKPSARSVAAWIAFTALVYSAGMVILMFVGCSTNDFAGYGSSTGNSPAVIQPACSAALNCTCDKENFAPICGIDGKMYISSCHAGCSVSELRASDNKTVYANCACITHPSSSMNLSSSIVNGKILQHAAVSGYCESGCKNFIIFVLIFITCVFMHSTSEVGSMLLVMRCTHPKDKAMAMGIIQSAIGLFGNVPCPILYGAVVDSACLIWKTVCGKHGACSLYDADTFRHYFLGITASIMFLAFIMDVIVWKKAHRIDIAPEENAGNNASLDPVKDNNSSDTYKKSAIAKVDAPDTSV